MTYRIAVDTGGTFCDFVLHNQETGEIRIAKGSSSPDDPSRSIVDGIREMLGHTVSPSDITFFSHGTTVGTNALLEGTGSKIGLIITEGFRGIYEVREQSRGFGKNIYDLSYEKPTPLVDPSSTEEASERVGTSGEVIDQLDVGSVRKALQRLKEQNIQSLAVVLLFSFLNPQHEQEIRDIASEELPGIPISISSEVLPQIREYYRLSTTLVNAYLSPVLSAYLRRLADRLRAIGVSPQGMFVMQSNGGVASFAEAGKLAATTALSGPAGGVMAACHLGNEIDEQDLITFDMGGTSCDVSLIHQGQPVITNRAKVAGYDLATPIIDIHTVSAGGGTIASINEVGVLKVGPRSAGADPGPIAYGRGGTEITVTDCNLVLGYLSPALLDGKLSLDIESSCRLISDRIVKPLGCSAIEAAYSVIRLINATMAEAVKAISSQRGYDLRNFYLVAFGGGGPVHAGRVALDLGMRGVLIPEFPGVTSALGLLLSDVRHDFVRSKLMDWIEVTPELIHSVLTDLREMGVKILSSEGFSESTMDFEARLDLRYRGQGYELTVPIPVWPKTQLDLDSTRRKFDDIHEERFGHRAEDAEVELVQIRMTAIGRVERPKIKGTMPNRGVEPKARTHRKVYFPETDLVEAPIFSRKDLPAGFTLHGPAIIEQYDTTIVVDPGLQAAVDDKGNILLKTSASL